MSDVDAIIFARGLTCRELRTAYVHGLNFCTGTFVIIMDADFSHHVRGLDLALIISPDNAFCLFLSPNLSQNSSSTSLALITIPP